MSTIESELQIDDVWETITRLDRDLRDASRLLGRAEARHLTDFYYQIQDFRIQAAGQIRASSESEEPNRVLDWIFTSTRTVENGIKRALGEYASQYRIGLWLQSITGIGPVISAGLMSHLDIRKANTAGHFWRFAGLDPTVVWEKKTKRPWNARLKVLCWKAGESFVKFQNHPRDYYGKLYCQRKELEAAKNEAGDFTDVARQILETKRFRKDTIAYKHYSEGRLPPGHIHSRARRYVIKIFLSHVHHAMYVDYHGADPPMPYVFEKSDGDHRHYIPLPNWPFDGEGKSLTALLDDEPET